MKVFLSSLENGAACIDGTPLVDYFRQQNVKMKWNLVSYYYVKGRYEIADKIKKNSELIMVDSGAHSFQKGKVVKWEEYTRQYAEFIKRYDDDKVVGYFEMDVDNVIGYERVLQLRKILESVSNKIIPVWHKNRGIQDFKDMCQKYSGKIIAITGFRNEDIKDEQYIMFLKYAKKHGCKVHCLGMTRKKILDKVPFDYVDSSSWKQSAIYGRVGKRKVSKDFSKKKREVVMLESYKEGMKMQEHYYNKWRKYEE